MRQTPVASDSRRVSVPAGGYARPLKLSLSGKASRKYRIRSEFTPSVDTFDTTRRLSTANLTLGQLPVSQPTSPFRHFLSPVVHEPTG